MIVMAVGLLLLGGLVTDGGRQLNAKLAAEATAEEAARAGAAMLDLREQLARIDPDLATEAVEAYCAVAMENDERIDECEVEDFGRDTNKHTDIISVRVTMSVDALLFGIIGVNELRVDVTAEASPVRAVAAPGEDFNINPFTPTPDYPTLTVDIPTTEGTPSVSAPVPTEYTTELCGVTTALPLTVGLTCGVTTTTQEPPPPPGTTITSTVFSTHPTSVPPFPPLPETP